MVPFRVPNIVRHLLIRDPKRDHNFDNHSYKPEALHVVQKFENPNGGSWAANLSWVSVKVMVPLGNP